tara:strand:- start:17 stop:484 length:468 start_codon:yes stop_codon:yes gene_type:complete
MSIKEFIDNTHKYHYLIVINKKVATLSSGNNSIDTKKKCLDIIKKKLESLKNMSIVKLTLKKITKKEIDGDKKSSLKSIGGPLLMKINVYEINSKGKLKMNDYEDRNNGLYITDKYLKKNTKISKKNIQKIAYKVINRKINNDFLVINLIEKILK